MVAKEAGCQMVETESNLSEVVRRLEHSANSTVAIDRICVWKRDQHTGEVICTEYAIPKDEPKKLTARCTCLVCGIGGWHCQMQGGLCINCRQNRDATPRRT
jgi:hypothetical protein